jgi:PAS domain S-box-containing protein
VAEALRESERKYRHLYQHTPVMMHSIDQEGRLVSVSDFWLQSLGYRRDEVIGHKSTEFLTPASQKYAEEVVLPAYFETGKCQDVPYQFIRRDGTVVDVLLSAIAEHDAEGRVIRSLAVLIDVTERKRAEQALRESEERFRLAARAASDALYDWDISTGAIWWNEGTQQAFGYPPAEPARFGIDWWTRNIHPDDRDRIDRSLGRALDQAAESWTDEYRFRRADGSYVPVLDRGYFVRNGQGRSVRMIGAMLDLSERLRMEELRAKEQEARAEVAAARELDRMKTNFVNAISHDLRTPLTSIVGYTEFLEDGIGGPITPQQREFVVQIEKSAKRLEHLVDNLLDFARLEAGTLKLKPAPADLGAHIREVLESLRPQAQQAELTLAAELPEDPLVVTMDAQRIERVLNNMLANALKFTPAGGCIAVRACLMVDHVRCEVADTGMGIAPEDVPKLFRRFGQLDAGAHKGGTGLGLSISKAIVEAHGGQIGVESEPGQGSTFWFTLPVRPYQGQGL